MNKRGLLKFSKTIILIVFIFLILLWIFPVNQEDISGSLVSRNIIEIIEPRSNSETYDNSILVKVTTKKPSTCKTSKMKFGGYYLPYVIFDRTEDYYHETTLLLDEGRNNFKIYCRQMNSKNNDYDYWSIKKR